MGKNYTKKEAIKIILQSAEQYKLNLLNKSLLFITMDKHKRTSSLEVHFVKRNFLHLTGVVIDSSNLSPNSFFDACIDKRLGMNDFEFAEDGTTNLKLAILPALMTKNLSANSVGDYNGVGIKLYTEKIAGSSKGCIGFRLDDETGFLLPNTLLNLDIRDCTKKPQERIIATYRKENNENSYSEIVHSAKDLDFKSIKFPKEYADLPMPDRQLLQK